MASSYRLTPADKASFDAEGYVIVRDLLSPAEVAVVLRAVEMPGGITQYAFEMSDGEGRNSKLALFNHPGEDVTGKVCRLAKVVGTVEGLLGGSVYHYHTKLIMKEAFTGGAFVWHQDFGFWYNNGALRPDMCTVMVALDPATAENGALQVIPKSHLCGRVTHKLVGEQTGADVQRVAGMLDSGRYERTWLHLAPGDAVFFHCNLLHKSDANTSASRRWAFLCAYNRVDNPCIYPHHCPSSGPPVIQEADNVLLCMDPLTPIDAGVKDFMVPVTFADDASLPSVTEMWKKRTGEGGGGVGGAGARSH